MKIVILVPHADDEVLGFGGIIQKHKLQGHEVTVVFAEAVDWNSKRYTLQAQGVQDVSNLLGYKFKWLDIEPKDLLQINDESISYIENVLADLNPSSLYIPSNTDTHQDHQALFNVVRISTRMFGKAPIKQIFCGEIISSSECCIQSNFYPNFYEPLSFEQVTKKQKAMELYSNELNKYPHPRSVEGIEIYAKKRGMECGENYAEAFNCLRYIA